ncbi:phage tail tube protein [Gluconacetobacter entanii]|uniref:phage tail tube protein n=1 Tax=Gluconacetobacter entanii TaxID=108528 RepID=UPI001C9346D4|nr:phage tail tube protein [Gluconacetobacter entanii]MBY4640286.1 phage tail tube protein [Gluconacetobacter entanii]MCW4579940.1 phage tail tube protein [Gluconacetobacter entanii]MCW4584653.1 phage tail tube protein [Gluconacetobacter entanii]MCW4588085.1 phage tail tube protein [Gluconacetobacter entanii]
MAGSTVGIFTVWWKGLKIEMKTGSTLRLPGNQNKTETAGGTGFRYQQYQVGQFKGTAILPKGTSLAAFQPDVEDELQVMADTGQQWSFPDAYLLDAPDLADNGGNMPLTWNMNTYKELLS